MPRGVKSADSLPAKPTGMERNSLLSTGSSHPVRLAAAVVTATRRPKTSGSALGVPGMRGAPRPRHQCGTEYSPACRKSLFSPLSKFSELHKSSENLGFQWRRTPFLGFPRTPFLSVAENLPLYRQPHSQRRAQETDTRCLIQLSRTHGRAGHARTYPLGETM